VDREKMITPTQAKTTREFLGYKSTIEKMVGQIVNPAEVDDILQESFLRVFEASRDREIEHTKSYLYRTARNLALNFIARKGNKLVDSIEEKPLLEVSSTDTNPVSPFESREKFRLFCEAVDELPPQCQRAFLLKRVYGYSLRDIARVLDISQSTAEKHVAKGLVRCADFMRDSGYSMGRKPAKGRKE
jgi:RNA polymerase sigma factor (sigma-70 family)